MPTILTTLLPKECGHGLLHMIATFIIGSDHGDGHNPDSWQLELIIDVLI